MRWSAVSFAAVLVAATFVAAGPPAQAGSICRDGTWTPSEGRGTCSSHGGVAQSGVPEPSQGVPTPESSAAPVPAPAVSATPNGNLGVVATRAQFQELAKTLKTAESAAGGAYKRSYFRHWIKQSDGCTTREVVLIRDASGGNRSGCLMLGATWFSSYDAVTTTNPSTFDIDHMVPLKEAWLSGASEWSTDRRTSFANDLGYFYSLLAVSASSNRSKGAQDPAAWMPPNASDRCSYIYEWVAVKWRWDLSMDVTEKRKVDSVMDECGDTVVPLPTKAQ
jgi:hypothetical protein